MVAKHTLSQGAEFGAPFSDEFEALANLAGSDLCEAVLLRLYRRSQDNRETSIRDLHQFVEMPLPDVFASLRNLESSKIIDIIDDPSDPFGAKLHLRTNAIEILRARRTAIKSD